jgi:hypothetical protein
VTDLLVTLPTPPRLAAHLRAVHDVAAQLLAWLDRHYPALTVDHDAVLFGAATHTVTANAGATTVTITLAN